MKGHTAMHRTLLGFIFLVIAHSLTLAQPREAIKQVHRGEGREGHHLSDLNLTEDQKRSMRSLQLDLERKRIDLQAKIQLLEVDLKSAAMSDKPDRGMIEKTLRSITDLQYQMKLSRIQHWFEVSKILTPEQQIGWKKRLKGTLDRGEFRKIRRAGHMRK
jgi:Spy/CpxP family protein refolding chaperone